MLTEASPEAGTYLLEQRFRYDYAAPVRRLRHRLLVVPRSRHGGQERLDHGLEVSGSPARVTTGSDGFGNDAVEVRAGSVREWIEFKAWALVEQRTDDGIEVLSARVARDDRLLASTPLTRANAILADAARGLVDGAACGLELAERACAWTYDALSYVPGVTNVQTTASDAIDARRGGCAWDRTRPQPRFRGGPRRPMPHRRSPRPTRASHLRRPGVPTRSGREAHPPDRARA